MRLAKYPEVTPESIALLQLNDCARLLSEWQEYRLRLVQAAKAAHLAFHAALTAALAGSANIGVYRENLRVAWLRYFEVSRSREVEPPSGDFVMGFKDLLRAARDGHPHGWLVDPLVLSDPEAEQIDRLTFVRACFEHPKPASHYFEPAWIAGTIPVAARLTLRCLEAVWHHLEPDEQAAAAEDVSRIEELCCGVTESRASDGD